MTTADQRLTRAELVERTGASAELVTQLVDAGMLTEGADLRHPLGDIHRVRIARAFVDSGIPLEALRRAAAAGTITFDYYDRLHPTPGPRSVRTYGDVKADVGDQAGLLGQLFAAFGLAEPDPESRLEEAEERMLLDLLSIVRATGERDLSLRVIRLLADATRRSVEAVMTVYDEAVHHVIEPAEGLPSQAVYERYLEPWTRFAQIAAPVNRWLTERHLSHAIDAYSVDSTEHYLALSGFVPKRTEMPPAVAFVDLSGFTRLAEERGDERVASLALDFGQLAEQHAEAEDGRMVKLLGDGALLRFPSAPAAVRATLSLLDALARAGMPPGHAGIHAGPIIVRDGDIFGRTVNLASRIADVAESGQLLVTAEVASSLGSESITLTPAGSAQLQGIAEPVPLLRVTRSSAA